MSSDFDEGEAGALGTGRRQYSTLATPILECLGPPLLAIENATRVVSCDDPIQRPRRSRIQDLCIGLTLHTEGSVFVYNYLRAISVFIGPGFTIVPGPYKTWPVRLTGNAASLANGLTSMTVLGQKSTDVTIHLAFMLRSLVLVPALNMLILRPTLQAHCRQESIVSDRFVRKDRERSLYIAGLTRISASGVNFGDLSISHGVCEFEVVYLGYIFSSYACGLTLANVIVKQLTGNAISLVLLFALLEVYN